MATETTETIEKGEGRRGMRNLAWELGDQGFDEAASCRSKVPYHGHVWGPVIRIVVNVTWVIEEALREALAAKPEGGAR